MGLFKKRESIIQNMAYMGIMAAINVIFVLFTYFIPFLLFLLIFLLPLCSAIISYYCKKIYFPIYFLVVTAICLVIDPSDTLFYVIPSLITGFIFGAFISIKLKPIFIVVIATVIQFGISLATLPLVNALTNRDVINDIARIFNLGDYAYLNYLKLSSVFFIALVQIVITYMVMQSELSKLGLEFNEAKNKECVIDVLTLSSIAFLVMFAFIYPPLSFIFLFLAIVFSFDRLTFLDLKYFKVYLIELGVIILGSIFFIAGLYSLIQKPLGLLLLGIIPLLLSITCIINKCLLSKRNKGTIYS